jgi:hypothetical protein
MVRDQFHVPAELRPEKICPYPLNRKLGGPHSQSGRFGEAVNALPLPGVKSRLLGRLAFSAVSLLTMLRNYNKLHDIREHLPVESCVRRMVE